MVQNRDIWRWTRPGCERGCTKSLAETFMQPADDFPIATPALTAGGGQTPKPARLQAPGTHMGTARTPYSQPSRTKLVTKAGIKAPK